MAKLRIEETPDKPVEQPPAPRLVSVTKPAATAPDVDHWKRLAIQTGERLQYAENQLGDLRTAADDARARFSKYKERLDKANQRVNELQIQLVNITAERDDLRASIAKQEVLARRVHEYRQSLLNGPLWDLFAELAVCPPAIKSSGGESA
jgi:septal ring factor EnvC (AmiA/AmiB activator)